MSKKGTMEFVEEDTGKVADLSALEDAGVGFDPTTQRLDLSVEEKRRTTALMLAITGYKELIIRDHLYLREVNDMARREEGPKVRTATMDAMIEAAIKFDFFIAGGYPVPQPLPPQDDPQPPAQGEESVQP